MKNPQVDQMEVLGAPFPNALRHVWAQGSGVGVEKAQGTRRAETQAPRGSQWAGLTFSSNGHQLDPLAGYEVQGLIDIGDLVHPHFASLRLGQAFT